MPKYHPIQTSFAAGEISPLMYGRTDTDGYKAGLSAAENMIIDSRGPARCRNGLRHLTSFDEGNARVIGFNDADGESYVIVFYNDIRILKPYGSYRDQEYILNGSFLGGWWGGSSDWDQLSVGNGTTSFEEGHVSLTPGVNSGDYESIHQQISIADGSLEYTVNINTAGSVLLDVTVSSDIAGGGNVYHQHKSRLVNNEFKFTPGAGVTNFYLTIQIHRDDIGEFDERAQIFSVSMSDENSLPVRVFSPYNEHTVGELYFVPVPASNAIYMLHPVLEPYKLSYDSSSEIWAMEKVVFVSPPSSWTLLNFPTVGTYYQGRLWLGSTRLDPETFWASKSGLPEDFTPGTGDLADDSLEFTLDQLGAITWMISTKNLIIGTSSGEYIVSSSGGVIIPGDIKVDRQSAYGSRKTQAIQLGDQVLYVSPDGRKVRTMQYEWAADNWLSKDLTFASEHITKGVIKRIAWAQNPDNILWAVLANGDLVGMTYERSNGIYGWHIHHTEGRVVDCTAVEGAGASLSVFAVQRESGKINIEMMMNNVQLDSWIDLESGTPTNTFSGLDHLEGKTVQIIADGSLHPDRVVLGGEIELQVNASYILVGLKFIPKIVTLPLENAYRGSSTLSNQKQLVKIFVEVLNSNAPLINDIRPPDRTPSTPMGIKEGVETRKFQVGTRGHSLEGVVTIEQDLSVPLNVLGIFAEVSSDNT